MSSHLTNSSSNDVFGATRQDGIYRTILVADDHALMRDGIKMLIARHFANVIVLEANNAEALYAVLASHRVIDVAIVDLTMPGMDAGAEIANVSQRFPDMPIIVMSSLDTADVVRRTLRVRSVAAFVPKSADTACMRTALDAALSGRKVEPASRSDAPATAQAAMTPRQHEVRRLLREGLSNKLIAAELGISEGTVKNHVSEIFRVLNTTNRTQVARLSIE
jgi:DNA-binding NarL/FixJ family response regulator